LPIPSYPHMRLDFEEITIILLVFKPCDHVVDSYSLLLLHYSECTKLSWQLECTKLSAQPFLASTFIESLKFLGGLSGLILGSRPLRVFTPTKLACSQLVVLPSAHTCTGECTALRDCPQNHNIPDIAILNLIIFFDMELLIGLPFDIGGGLKQHLS
jgi:hypothetical protein